MHTRSFLRLDRLVPLGDGLRLDDIAIDSEQVRVEVTATHPSVPCPTCSTPATQIRGRYTRTLADLPWGGLAVQLQLHVRKFACHNSFCPQRIFTERLPALAAPYARRMTRLTEIIQFVGLVAGGEATATLLARLGMPTSPTTVLRLVRSLPLPERPTPSILGVDDWSLRKGKTYATLLVDLERHHPVAMLQDRSAEVLASWLKQHPGVRVIARDRSGAFADGARQGAPDAIQVADRFHLMMNWGDTLEDILNHHRTHLYTIAPAQQPATKPSIPAFARPERPAEVAERQRHRAQRLQRYETIRDLHAKGMCVSEIARALHLNWKTVRKYAQADVFPEKPIGTPRRGSILKPYEPYLYRRWQEGCHDGMRLWREIVAQGYRGSRTLVASYVAQLRREARSERILARFQYEHGVGEALIEDRQPLTPREVVHLFLRRTTERTEEQIALIKDLCARHDEIAAAEAWTHRFASLLRERQGAQAFDSWMQDALASPLREVRQFAQKIRQDEAAVRAACTLEWSTGQVEGQINRLKLIKRSMYGRAKFDLLRQRVLYAA